MRKFIAFFAAVSSLVVFSTVNLNLDNLIPKKLEPDAVIRTSYFEVYVKFQPGTESQINILAEESLRYYLSNLTLCLNEKSPEEILNSLIVLHEGITSSCIMNMIRPRGKKWTLPPRAKEKRKGNAI
jgi:hypothetical protein